MAQSESSPAREAPARSALPTTLAAAYAACFYTVRNEDRDCWLASLFWPEAKRRHAHAVLAFALEIAKVPDSVSESMLGEIRFQWWRDAIEKNEPAGNPVAEALLDTVARFNLDVSRLLAMIEARSFDLYDDLMPSELALENYLRDTSAALFETIARVLAPGHLPPPCTDAAGRAFGLTTLLRRLPLKVMKGKLFIPRDLLLAQGATPDDVLAHHATPQFGAVLALLRARARMHLGEMQVGLGEAGPAAGACLPAFLCEAYLRRMERPGYDPFAGLIELPQWRRQLTLWRGARRLG